MKICIFRKEERNEVGMTIEFDPKEVVSLSFVPVGPRINLSYRRHHRRFAVYSCTYHHSAKIKIITAEIVNDLQLVVFNPVNTVNNNNNFL